MMRLTNSIWNLIAPFKARTYASYGAYVSENTQYKYLDNFNNKNLLKDCTLYLTPNGFQTGKALSIIPTGTNGDLVLSRASDAYRTRSSGLLERNAWRYNQVAPSQNFSGGSAGFPWSAQGLGAGWSLGFTAPDGTSTAVKLLIGTQNTRNDYGGTYINTGTVGTVESFELPETRTLLFYTKINADEDYIGIRLLTGVSGYSYNDTVNMIKINLTSKSVVQYPSGFTATVGILDVGSGWLRICINSSLAWNKMQFHSSRTLTGQAVTNGNSPFFWGFQVVAGNVDNNFPYFATVAARANIPRIDYSQGSEPVILLEPLKSNLTLQSQTFDNATWIKTNMTVTANTTASPNGEINADTLLATAANAQIRQNCATNVTAIGRIGSVYVKRKTGTGDFRLELGRFSTSINPTSDWQRVQTVDVGTTGTYSAVTGSYNITTSVPHGLTTGDFIIASVNANIAVPSVTVVSPTNITFSSGAGTATGAATIYINHIKMYLNNSADEVYVWGSQLESRQNFTLVDLPSTYIPTTTALVTRAVETVALNNLVSNGIFGTNWSMYVNMKRIGGSNNGSIPIIGISNTINVDFFTIGGLSNSLLFVGRREASGSVTATTLTYQPPETSFFKVLFTMESGKARLWIDGTILYETTFVNPQNLLKLFTSTNQTLMLKELVMWNRTLTPLEIQNLYLYPYYNTGINLSNDLQAIVNRAKAEGFTLPTNTQLAYMETLISDMKSSGVWASTDCFLNYAWNDINLENFSRICWKNPNGQLSIFNGGYTYKTVGFAGNGANAFVNTMFNPGLATFNYTLNNAGRMIIISEAGVILPGTKVYDSAGGGTGNVMRSGNLTSQYINSGNVLNAAFNYGGTGIKSIQRDSSTVVRLQDGNTLGARTQTSTAFSAGNQYLLSGVGGLYGDSTVSCYYIGGSINDTNITNFRTSYNTFLSNLGLTPIA